SLEIWFSYGRARSSVRDRRRGGFSRAGGPALHTSESPSHTAGQLPSGSSGGGRYVCSYLGVGPVPINLHQEIPRQRILSSRIIPSSSLYDTRRTVRKSGCSSEELPLRVDSLRVPFRFVARAPSRPQDQELVFSTALCRCAYGGGCRVLYSDAAAPLRWRLLPVPASIGPA